MPQSLPAPLPLDDPPPRAESTALVHGTLAVAACGAFALNLYLSGTLLFRTYRLVDSELASPGQLIRNGAYILAYLGTGVCLLYLLLALQRFDGLFARLAKGAGAQAGNLSGNFAYNAHVKTARNAGWICTVPLLGVGGTLLVFTLFVALAEGAPFEHLNPFRLVLAIYLVIAGLCAEVAVQILRRAQAAGLRLAGEAPPHGDRWLFWSVVVSAVLRFSGLIYYVLSFGGLEEGTRDLLRVDHLVSIAIVIAAAVAFGALSRLWGDALAAWKYAAPGNQFTTARLSPGGGWPAGVFAMGAVMFVGEAVNAYRYGSSLLSPVAAFLMQTYVVIPWLILRLDARRMRLAVETLAPPPPKPEPSPRSSIAWATRMLGFSVLLAIFGQPLVEALWNGIGISPTLIWNSFLNRDLFWFVCLGSLTRESVVLEDALERLEETLRGREAESAGA